MTAAPDALSADARFWDERENVVIEEQPETAVYSNAAGAVVIRQRSPEGVDEDPFVFMRPERVTAVCRAMLREIGLEHVLHEGARKPPAGSARQDRSPELDLARASG